MQNRPNFKKTTICALIGILFTPQLIFAAPVTLSQQPAGVSAIPPTPNVVLTVDDSGSMAGSVGGGDPQSKMFRLREALTNVFNNTTTVPDGKIRLAWQVMHNNGGAPSAGNLTVGAVNSMKVLDAAHRANFMTFVNTLTPGGGTPSHQMMKQAYDYMKAPQSINSPWASKPGTTELPYLGCRRAYHIFMTDGGWNGQTPAEHPGNVDNTVLNFPDGTVYNPASDQSNVYKGALNNLLADWAMKMWAEDLQPAIPNIIQPSTTDGVPATETHGAVTLQRYWNPKHNPATWQHLVQYTIGFGSDAYSWPAAPHWSMADDDNYGAGGDYSKLVDGTQAWVPTVFQNNGPNNPAELWHMAINSRGLFFPTGPGRKYTLEDAFKKIMQTIAIQNTADVTSIGASSTTNVRTDINQFIAGYDPLRWSGYVYANKIDTAGNVTPEPNWGTNTGLPAPKDRKTTAQKLDALATVSSRLILTTNDVTNTGVSFEWDPSYTKLSATQSALLDGGGLGQDRVNFLRGDRTKEGGSGSTPFRIRDSRQGDIVNSAVWYTGSPVSNYSTLGYKSFAQAYKNRLPMIYVGGNDGMLHGFSAYDGEEKIAYVPKAVIPELSKLSDPAYTHQYYVDGSPFTADVDFANNPASTYTPDWRTVLVGTLGAGGKGYFVLDVTKPGGKPPTGSPASNFATANAASLVVMDRTLHPAQALTVGSDDEDIGHIFASPVMDDNNAYRTNQVTMMNDKRWAVIMGNGYNSKNERPVLLIQYLDGAKELKKIVATGAAVPPAANVVGNGLSSPRLVDINSDGKVDVVYAGDLKGNMWKFDLTDTVANNWQVAQFSGSAQPLFTAIYPPTSKVQPITAAPVVKANDRGAGGMMVAFGTGVNLTDADRSSTDVQSVYSIHDNTKYKFVGTGTNLTVDSSVTPVAVNSSRADLVGQTLASSAIGGSGDAVGYDFWQMTQNSVNYDSSAGAVKKGWYFDLQVSSERVLRPMSFFDASNLLMVYSTTPAYGGSGSNDESCTPAGTPEKDYLTIMNIMDGRKASVQLMDANGDGYYNASATKDNGVSRMTVPTGATSSIVGKKTIDLSGGALPTGASKRPKFARMPEQPMRPSWRQVQ